MSSSYTAAGSSAASVAPAIEPQEGLPDRYYYVGNRHFFYYDNGDITPLGSRPKNRWIYHSGGWSGANREKKWRMWDGIHDMYA